VIFNTHKIKSKKEYGFLKQKNNRNGFDISFFCFKNPHPFRRTSSISSTLSICLQQKLHGQKENKKINKKKVKVSSSFKKRKFKPTVFNKISTLRFRFATTLISKSNPHFRTTSS
jgi:hypothetical protein